MSDTKDQQDPSEIDQGKSKQKQRNSIIKVRSFSRHWHHA